MDELCHGFTEQRLPKEGLGRSDDEIQPDPTDEGINRQDHEKQRNILSGIMKAGNG